MTCIFIGHAVVKCVYIEVQMLCIERVTDLQCIFIVVWCLFHLYIHLSTARQISESDNTGEITKYFVRAWVWMLSECRLVDHCFYLIVHVSYYYEIVNSTIMNRVRTPPRFLEVLGSPDAYKQFEVCCRHLRAQSV